MKKRNTSSILGIYLAFYSFIAVLNIVLDINSNDCNYLKIGISLSTIASLVLFLLNKKIGVTTFLLSQIMNMFKDFLFFVSFKSIFIDLCTIVFVLLLAIYEKEKTT